MQEIEGRVGESSHWSGEHETTLAQWVSQSLPYSNYRVTWPVTVSPEIGDGSVGDRLTVCTGSCQPADLHLANPTADRRRWGDAQCEMQTNQVGNCAVSGNSNSELYWVPIALAGMQSRVMR